MAAWTLHGRQRQARRDTTDKNCPLPTPEDRLLFILIYLKQNPTQLRPGRVFGMRQSKATPWMHVLLPVLRHTWRTLGNAPLRHVAALQARLEVAGPAPPLDTPPAAAGQAASPPVAPLVVMMAPSDPSRAPTMRRPRNRVIAARTSGTRGKTCS